MSTRQPPMNSVEYVAQVLITQLSNSISDGGSVRLAEALRAIASDADRLRGVLGDNASASTAIGTLAAVAGDKRKPELAEKLRVIAEDGGKARADSPNASANTVVLELHRPQSWRSTELVRCLADKVGGARGVEIRRIVNHWESEDSSLSAKVAELYLCCSSCDASAKVAEALADLKRQASTTGPHSAVDEIRALARSKRVDGPPRENGIGGHPALDERGKSS